MYIFKPLTMVLFLYSWSAVAQELPYNFHDGGYAYQAGQMCKETQLLVEFDEFTRNQPRFREGRATFNKAISRRSLKWACGAALRMFDGTKGLGPAILARRK